MDVQGSEPTKPCKTMIRNVFTFTTAFIAFNASVQTDATLILSLYTNASLKKGVAQLPGT